jgi:hypothetical protein
MNAERWRNIVITRPIALPRRNLPESDKDHIERWIDTYGNLTLTGYNPELGNKGFAAKREIFAKSHFEINKTVAGESSWSIASIRRRGEVLAYMAAGVWSGPMLVEPPSPEKG